MNVLEIYYWVCQRKNFENRFTFEEVMGKSLVSCFFWITVYIPNCCFFGTCYTTASFIHHQWRRIYMVCSFKPTFWHWWAHQVALEGAKTANLTKFGVLIIPQIFGIYYCWFTGRQKPSIQQKLTYDVRFSNKYHVDRFIISPFRHKNHKTI